MFLLLSSYLRLTHVFSAHLHHVQTYFHALPEDILYRATPQVSPDGEQQKSLNSEKSSLIFRLFSCQQSNPPMKQTRTTYITGPRVLKRNFHPVVSAPQGIQCYHVLPRMHRVSTMFKMTNVIYSSICNVETNLQTSLPRCSSVYSTNIQVGNTTKDGSV